MAKKPAKKPAGKPAKKKARGPARKTIDVSLTHAQIAKAKECLERSGSILIGFEEVSLTKLPKSLAPSMTIKD